MELSRRLQVKPLDLGQVKVFRLIHAGKIDKAITNSDGSPAYAYNKSAHYTGYFTIFDNYEKDPTKKNKILKNVTGWSTEIKDGKEVINEIIENIVFTGQGVCIVKHTEPNKLICLTRANENESNPFRDKRIPALWKELSVTEGRKVEIELADMSFDAELIAMRGDIIEVKSICDKVGIKTKGKQTEDIRHDLRMFGKMNPREVLRNSKNIEAKVKIMFEDASALRLISFLDDTRNWIWEDDEAAICAVEIGKDPEEVLIDFLLKNKEASKRLAGYLKGEVLTEAE